MPGHCGCCSRSLASSTPQRAAASPPTLPPLTTSYRDYVRWQRQLLRGAEGERQWTYWNGVLGGELPVLNLPTDRLRPPEQTFNGASYRFQLDPRLSADVRAFASAEGTTVYMVLLAIFQVLLHRYTGQDDVILGSPTSGRTRREFAGIVGDFINTIVLRASCAGDPSFRAFLAQVSEKTLEAIAHEEFPFSLIVERLGGSRDPNRAPLFQVLFNFLKPQRFHDVIELWVGSDTGETVPWGGLSLGPFPLAQQEGQVDLALEIVDGKTCLHGLLKYNTDLFDQATIVRMAGHFETLVRGVLANPEEAPLQVAAPHRGGTAAAARRVERHECGLPTRQVRPPAVRGTGVTDAAVHCGAV